MILTLGLTELIFVFKEIAIVKPPGVKAFETSNNTASAGYRKQLVNSTLTFTWLLHW